MAPAGNVHVARDHAGREKRVSPVRQRRGLQGRQCEKLNGYNIGRAQIYIHHVLKLL